MEDNSPVNARSKPRARIENACLPCQSRKIKCDGNGLLCSQCSKRGAHCVYKQRRTRGPGKGNEHVRELEKRLEKLEQRLRTQSETLTGGAGSAHNSEAREKSPQMTNDESSPLLVDMTLPQLHSSTAQPSTAPSDPYQTTEGTGLIRAPELSRLPRYAHFKMVTGVGNSGKFPIKTFIPLHAQADLVGLVLSTAEEVGDTYPLFTPGYVKALTDQVVNSSKANTAYEPALWAISSALVAIAMQWKAENSSLAQVSPMMWSHFKNAFSMLQYLMTKSPGVLSFHALVLMAVFLQGCAEMRLAAHLITSAVRVAQMAVIPIRNQGHDIAAELNLRAFWAVYALDVEISKKLMILPVIDHHHLPQTLPSHHPPEPMTGSTAKQVCILGLQAGLANMQSKIHNYILSVNQPGALAPDIESLARFDQELDLWAHSLPPDFRPSNINQSVPRQLSPSVILLHYQYYHLKSTLFFQRAAAQDGNPEHTTHLPHDVSSARATIRLLSAIPLAQEQFFCIWRMLLYPLSMVLLLFYDVLRDSKSPSAESGVLAIEEFVDYLKRIKQELDCDVHKMFEGCIKMHRVARSAVSSHQCLPFTCTSINLDYPTVLFERLRQILTSRKNYLSLAQRLMSDMPDSEDEMLMGLSKALAIDWDRNDGYGPFVPDVLRADSYNFGFEFMV